MQSLTVDLGERAYPIHIGPGLLDRAELVLPHLARKRAVIVTNTTTQDDIALFRQAGVSRVITTTPMLEGRSFGTNMMEAAIAAVTGRTAPVDYAHPGSYFQELDRVIDQIHLLPQIQEL